MLATGDGGGGNSRASTASKEPAFAKEGIAKFMDDDDDGWDPAASLFVSGLGVELPMTFVKDTRRWRLVALMC